MWTADRPVRLFWRDTGTLVPTPMCVACTFTRSGSYSGTGGTFATFSALASAALQRGEQHAAFSYVLVIAEVPEPATWAMLIAGFEAVGVAARRPSRGMTRAA